MKTLITAIMLSTIASASFAGKHCVGKFNHETGRTEFTCSYTPPSGGGF